MEVSVGRLFLISARRFHRASDLNQERSLIYSIKVP